MGDKPFQIYQRPKVPYAPLCSIRSRYGLAMWTWWFDAITKLFTAFVDWMHVAVLFCTALMLCMNGNS